MSEGASRISDVPTADSTTNLALRDVAGNKEDAAVVAVGTTASIIAYIKGILTAVLTPSANETANAYVTQSVGNKTDTAVDDVGTTISLMAYIKGLIQELDQRMVSKCVTATTVLTTYQDVVNITDKGVLTGISQYHPYSTAEDNGSLKIIIDGTTIFDSIIFTCSSSGYTANSGVHHSLAFNHRFNTSLQVQHHTAQATSYGSVHTFVAYTIDD